MARRNIQLLFGVTFVFLLKVSNWCKVCSVPFAIVSQVYSFCCVRVICQCFEWVYCFAMVSRGLKKDLFKTK